MFTYKLRNKEIRRGAKGSKSQIPITKNNMGEWKKNHEKGCVKVKDLWIWSFLIEFYIIIP